MFNLISANCYNDHIWWILLITSFLDLQFCPESNSDEEASLGKGPGVWYWRPHSAIQRTDSVIKDKTIEKKMEKQCSWDGFQILLYYTIIMVYYTPLLLHPFIMVCLHPRVNQVKVLQVDKFKVISWWWRKFEKARSSHRPLQFKHSHFLILLFRKQGTVDLLMA